jgi:hypothetical protein
MTDFIFELITILDISIIYTMYFIFAASISIIINRTFGNFDIEKYKTRSSFIIFLEILFEILITGIMGYFIRILVSNIPLPYIGYRGYNRIGLTEISGGIILYFILITFQPHLKNKFFYLYQRIFGTSLN